MVEKAWCPHPHGVIREFEPGKHVVRQFEFYCRDCGETKPLGLAVRRGGKRARKA